MKNRKYILYLDMDGVLVDFDKGYVNLTGTDIKTTSKTMGDKVARGYFLDAGTPFWENLQWIRGGKEVVDEAINLFQDVNILSSMGTTDITKGRHVEEGKRLWIKKHIPSFPLEKVFVVPGRHEKQNYSKPNAILVDDMPDTIHQWNAKGGIGIHHNYKVYRNTIYSLRDIVHPTDHIRLSELAKGCFY